MCVRGKGLNWKQQKEISSQEIVPEAQSRTSQLRPDSDTHSRAPVNNFGPDDSGTVSISWRRVSVLVTGVHFSILFSSLEFLDLPAEM